MNNEQIKKKLNIILKSKNYKKIKKTFTLEERLLIIELLKRELDPFDNSLSSIKIYKSIFLEEEASQLFYQYLEENEELASLIGICLSDKEKETILKEEPLDDETRCLLISSFTTDKLKTSFIDDIGDDYLKAKTVMTILDDNLKFNYLEAFTDDDDKCHIIETFVSDELKIKCFNLFENEYHKCELITLLSSDELKIKYLDYFTSRNTKNTIVTTLKEDKNKINYLNSLTKEEDKISIIKSLKSTNLFFQQLSLITNFSLIKKVIENLELSDKCPISQELIDRYSKVYQLDSNYLSILVQKFSYKILNFLENENIKKIFTLTKEDLDKYLKIFSDNNIILDKNAINNVANSLLQKQFKYEYANVCSIFSTLNQFIQAKNIEEIINIFNEINQAIPLNKYLGNNLDLKQFIECLLNNEYFDILEKITNDYITLKSNKYVNERLKNIYNDLDLDLKYEKSFIIKKVIATNNLDNLFKLIDSIDDYLLTDEEKILIQNKDLLMSIINFKKNPNDYYESRPTSKELDLFTKIFNILYEENKLVDTTDDINAKMIYVPKVVSKEYLISILTEIDVQKLKKQLFVNVIYYNKLLELLNTYKLLGSGSTYNKLLEKARLDLDNITISSFINNFSNFYPDLVNRVENNILTKITLPCLLEAANSYGTSSNKYSYALEEENYRLICSNPPDHVATATKEERLELAINYIKVMYQRKYITIPPIDKNININEKEINVEVGNFTNARNLTYGERTGSCMRILGVGNSLFKFCLTNKNGFHIEFNNPDTNEFISRVSGFRNGNTVFLNQLRQSVSKKYNNTDLIKAIKEVAKIFIEESKTSEYPIDNVVISNQVVMSKHKPQDLGINDIKETLPDFYTDVNTKAVLLASSDKDNKLVPLKLGSDKVTNYLVQREKIKSYNFNEISKITEAIAKIQIRDQLLEDIPLYDCNYLIKDNIFKCFVGEDWYLTIDYLGKIESFIMKNSNQKDIALKEIELLKKELSNEVFSKGEHNVKKRS